MNKPQRWLEAGSEAPPEILALLAHASPPTRMTDEDFRRTAGMVAAGVVAPALWAPLAKWLGTGTGKVAGGILGVGGFVGAAALVAISLPPARPLTTPALPAPAVVTAADDTPVAAAPDPPAAVPAPPSAARPGRRAGEPQRSALARELALIDAAARLVERDPGAALRRLRVHETEFPDGRLAAERDFLAVRACEKLGDFAQARTKAEKFLRRHPGSLHEDAVRHAMERFP